MPDYFALARDIVRRDKEKLTVTDPLRLRAERAARRIIDPFEPDRDVIGIIEREFADLTVLLKGLDNFLRERKAPVRDVLLLKIYEDALRAALKRWKGETL